MQGLFLDFPWLLSHVINIYMAELPQFGRL